MGNDLRRDREQGRGHRRHQRTEQGENAASRVWGGVAEVLRGEGWPRGNDQGAMTGGGGGVGGSAAHSQTRGL